MTQRCTSSTTLRHDVPTSVDTPNIAHALGLVAAKIAQHVETAARRLYRHRAVAHMRELDDHILADVGITRGDLEEALERSPFQDPTTVLAKLKRQRAERPAHCR